MRLVHILCLLALLLAACSPPTATPERLPTRSISPLATPFLVSAQDYFEEGLARQEAGEVAGALQSLTWAIEREPGFAPAYVARGAVYLAQGEPGAALTDADAALEIEPRSAGGHALRGEALRLLGLNGPALEAFGQALVLDPALAEATFRSRWLTARAAHDAVYLRTLSREYAYAHPQDPVRYYYQAWSTLEFGTTRTAINLLIEAIETTPDPPAVLWLALGEAYMADQSWKDAIPSLESVLVLVRAGDTSLDIHTDQPIADLFSALGVAYLRVGRCVDAESMLAYAIAVGAPTSEYNAALREARICQTPTPTVTPYPTATPYIWVWDTPTPTITPTVTLTPTLSDS